jgi:glycosyltransferase involved in cell wall biosynthesis
MPIAVPVLFLFPSLQVGGAERQLEALVRRLDRHRFLPIVACQHAGGPVAEALRAEGVAVRQLSGPRRLDPFFLPRTLALVRRRRVRIVCTQGFSTGVVGRLAALWGGAPVRIVLEHSTGERDMSPAKHRLNRMLHSMTSAWVAVAQGQVPYLTQTKGIPPEQIHVVHNGIDAAAYDLGNRRAAERRRVRQELGIDPTAPVAGSIAVLRPEKNLRSFVGAAAQVLRTLPEARFVIVGDGPQRQELFQEIMLWGLEGRVLLAGWRDDIAAVLAAMDVAVLCSTDVETFPVSFLEAMAAGLPLVATRVGGLPEMVEPGENGLLVSPGSTDELAQALGQVLADRDRTRRWGEASRRRVRQEFGVAPMVQRYEALFEALLRPSGDVQNPRSR